MSAPFADKIEILRRPHVGPSLFLDVDWPTGKKRYHDGAGTVTVGGYDWEGVTDPFGNRAVIGSTVDYPEFGTAPSYQIAVVGCDAAFMKTIVQTNRQIEGRRANLWFAAFDAETAEAGVPLTLLVKGRITAARTVWAGVGQRTVLLGIESLLQAKNFPITGTWSFAGHERANPGDKGGEFIGVPVSEVWK